MPSRVQEATPRRAAPAPHAGGGAAHRRAKSESVDYDFGWETESDEDEGDSPTSDDPSPAKPKRASLDRPAVRASCCYVPRAAQRARATRRRAFPRPDAPRSAQAQAPSPQRHRRTVSAHARRTEPPVPPRAAAAEAAVVTVLDALRGHAGAALIICLCVLLSLTGHGLVASVALEAVAGTPARVLFIGIAFVSLAIAGPVTHGLGGRLRHSKTGGWRFFQPWRGGVAFVACQALGWALYSVSIAAFGVAFWLIGAALTGRGVAHAGLVLPATFWVAGAAGVGAQVVLACSLLTYRPGGAAPPPPPAAKQASALPAREALVRHGAMLGVLFMVYAPCHLLVAAVATLFLALPPAAATAVLAAASAAYARTYAGHPAHTGTRTWPRFRSYCESVLSVALSRWFGTVRVLRTAPHHQAGPPGTPIVFGYHPHGMYPAAAAWFHLTPQWRENFPGVAPVTMGASAIFMTPMLRDVVMWSGARVVSRLSVRRALHTERRPIVLCPGGQAELVEHRAGTETVLCTRHKGFIRCALEVNAPVCPIFVFGESQAQRNLFSVKRLQRWTAKKLGFPFPFMPGGYMRVLPLPEPRPLTFVVGSLIPPPEGRDPAAPVTDAEVDAIHKRYYEELVVRMRRRRACACGRS